MCIHIAVKILHKNKLTYMGKSKYSSKQLDPDVKVSYTDPNAQKGGGVFTRIGRWLFELIIGNMQYIFLMVATMVSTIIVQELIIPYLWHPYRWGGVPWAPPNGIVVWIAKILLNCLFVWGASTLNCCMASSQHCHELATRRKVDAPDTGDFDINKSYSIKTSMKFGLIPVITYIISHIVIHYIPFIKTPAMMALWFFPYIDHLVTNTYVSIPVVISAILSNILVRSEVCGSTKSFGFTTNIMRTITDNISKPYKFIPATRELRPHEKDEILLDKQLTQLLNQT